MGKALSYVLQLGQAAREPQFPSEFQPAKAPTLSMWLPFISCGLGGLCTLRCGLPQERDFISTSLFQGRAGSLPHPGEPEASDPPVHRQHQTGHL